MKDKKEMQKSHATDCPEQNSSCQAKYEVQTYTICDGWINTWVIYDENNRPVPERFNTIEEAQSILDEFFQDIEAEIKNGDRLRCEKYNPDDFRIIAIN